MKKLVFSLFLGVNTLFAYNAFSPLGFKATGMGGVGTANAPASLAAYYNPALLLASPNSTEFLFGVGIKYRENNIANNLDTLENLELDDTIDNIEASAQSSLDSFTNFDSDAISDAISSGTFTSQNIADTIDTLVENDVITQSTIDTLISDGTIDSETQALLEEAGVLDSSGNLIKSMGYSKASDDGLDELLQNLSITLNTSQEDRDKIKSIQQTISNFSDSNALYFSVNSHLSALIDKNFALGIYTNLDAYLKINTSASHTELIIEDEGQYVKYDPDTDKVSFVTQEEYENSSIMYAIEEGLININAKAMVLTEVPLTFSGVSQYLDGYLAYGANLKFMSMEIEEKTIDLGEGSDSLEDVVTDADIEFNNSIGIDLGLAYQPRDSGVILGLAGKNVNSPSFTIGGEEITIDPSYRVGVSRQILNSFAEIAIDYDITKNDTLIDGDTSQYIGAGVEFHPTSWFSVRTGVMRDIGDNSFDDGFVYTAGLGIGSKWTLFDISAMISDKNGYYDGDDIPRYMQINFSLISKWGSR